MKAYHDWDNCKADDCEVCQVAVDNGWVYACDHCHLPIQVSRTNVYKSKHSDDYICPDCKYKEDDKGSRMNRPIRSKVLRHIHHARLMLRLGFMTEVSMSNLVVRSLWPLREKLNQRGQG